MGICRKLQKIGKRLRCSGGVWLAALLCLQMAGAPAQQTSFGAISPAATPAWDSYDLVAHAIGSTEEFSCVPSLETFLANYERGYRVFECDLTETADGKLVLIHDWSEGLQPALDPSVVPTEAEFLSAPIRGEYTPLTLDDLLQLMVRYPDIHIITDTKTDEPEAVERQFSTLVSQAEALGLSHLLDRMVVQLYSPEMQDTVSAVYPFREYILTLYNTDFYGETELFSFYAEECSKRGIQKIVMWYFLFSDDFLPIMYHYGIDVYVHTVNDPVAAAALIARGVSGVYSDRISPAAFSSLSGQ